MSGGDISELGSSEQKSQGFLGSCQSQNQCQWQRPLGQAFLLTVPPKTVLCSRYALCHGQGHCCTGTSFLILVTELGPVPGLLGLSAKPSFLNPHLSNFRTIKEPKGHLREFKAPPPSAKNVLYNPPLPQVLPRTDRSGMSLLWQPIAFSYTGGKLSTSFSQKVQGCDIKI